MGVDQMTAQDRAFPAVRELEGEAAVQWEDLSERIGTAVQPVLEGLARTLPSVTAVMISTADGFNLCALGLNDERVDRISAMGSALHSVARAATEALAEVEGTDQPLDMLSISHGSYTTVVLTVPGLGDGSALLWVTGNQDSLGAMIFRAKASVADLQAVFTAAFAA